MTKTYHDVPNTAPAAPGGPDGNFGLPERLKYLRKRMRMSRTVLSECCGLSKNVVALYENGQRLPSVASLVSLAEFFDVSTDFLLGRKTN